MLGAGRDRRAVVDVQHVGDERSLGAGTDLATDRGALPDILIAGAAQDRYRQKRILRAVGHCHKAEAFAGVEPFDLGLHLAAGGKLFAEEVGAAIEHRCSNLEIACAERRERETIAQKSRIALAWSLLYARFCSPDARNPANPGRHALAPPPARRGSG